MKKLIVLVLALVCVVGLVGCGANKHNCRPLYGEEMVGELKIYDIEPGKSASLGITMKNSKYKDRGFGTRAEQLAIEYVFYELDIPVLYADSILTNTRSQHVLEKVGFQFVYADEERKHYQISRK